MSDETSLGPLPVFAIVFGGAGALAALIAAGIQVHAQWGPWPVIGVGFAIGASLTTWGLRNAHRVS